MTLDIATISIMVALSLGLFAGMLTVMAALRSLTHEFGELRVQTVETMQSVREDVREEVRDEVRRFGERLTHHEQSGH